jgi:GT2 family glycosyltransferase
VPVEDGDAAVLPRLVGELERAHLVELEIVLADLTLAGELARHGFAGTRVVRGTPGSRGSAYRAALAASDAPLFAWQLAGARAPAGRLRLLADALARTPEALLATSDLLVRAADGGERPAVFPAQGAPPACWETAVLARREALLELETASFAPSELALLERWGCAGRRVHLHEPLALVPEALFEARAARTAQDAALLELARAPHAGPPEVTVMLATHDRRDVLFECLSGFCRQLVAPGALELVVVDDGSQDGTEELARALKPAVPFTFLRHEQAGGASRARALGLPHARGRLVLFANDDTLPFPDTVALHLAAHAALAPRKVAVLGTFEQPAEHLSNALMRLLERTHYVFGYEGMRAGQTLGGAHFYTCNTSVELEAVRAAGGFDPEFSMFAEDTDLGLRLERAGVALVYRPECRALHSHFLTFDDLRRRQAVVAKAHVRLLKKHPERLAQSKHWAALTAEELARRTAAVAPHLAVIEAAGRTLAGVDFTALAEAGPSCRATAQRIAGGLAALLPRLNRIWWDQGFLAGFAEHGVSGFPALVKRAEAAHA